MSIDLKTAKIKKGRKNGQQPYIYIERNGRYAGSSGVNDVIRLAFSNSATLSKWMHAIMVATMTDQELMSSAREVSENKEQLLDQFN